MKDSISPQKKEKLSFWSSKILKQKSFWLGVMIPFILTLGLYQGFFYLEDKDNKGRFEKDAKMIISTFSEKLERYEDIVVAVQSFYAASQHVDADEWENFIKATLSHNVDFPAIDTVSYIQKVSHKNTTDLICPRVYSYPQNSDPNHLGLDLCSDPQMRELFLQQFDWNRTYVGSDEKNHLTLILPQYSEGSPPQSQKETTVRTQGWIVLKLDLEKFISAFFPDQKQFFKISLQSQDKTIPIYAETHVPSENVFSQSVTLPFSSTALVITYNVPLKRYEINSVTFIGYLILGFGTFLSLISGLLVLSFFSTKGQATLIAEEMNKNIKEREARIRQLVDATPGAIYSCTPDEERCVTFLSDFIENITGFPAAHFIGQSTSDFTKLIHPEDRSFRVHAILEGIEKKGRFSCEYRLINKNKTEKWLFEQGHLISDEGGTPQQIVGAIFDITSRKIAEQEAERLSLALQNAAECIAFLDRHLMFTEVNPSFAELTGWTQEEMISLALPIIIHPDDFEKAQTLYKTSLVQPKIRNEIRGVKADGSLFYMSMTFVSSFDKNKNLLGTYCFVKDITYRKKVEEELRKAKDEALEASRAKSEFLAMMSHELRTPLNAIIGYSDLLAEQAQDEKQTQMAGDLNRIKEAGQHLLILINDILDVSKLEAGKTEVHYEVFSLDDLILNVNGMTQPLMKLNHNEFIYEGPALLGLMNSDFVKLRQNLLNLLSNAAKFTENGKISLKVKNEKNQKEDWLVFSVTDTGCGITPQQLEKLFNPFIQADSSTTRKYGGTGLGLTLVKRYTEMIGGTITVDSIPDQGTTFTMRIPRGSFEDATQSA